MVMRKTNFKKWNPSHMVRFESERCKSVFGIQIGVKETSARLECVESHKS